MSLTRPRVVRSGIGAAGPDNPLVGLLAAPQKEWDRLNDPKQLRDELCALMMLGEGDNDTLDYLATLLLDQKQRPFGYRVWCNKMVSGNVVLIGDAAHAMGPAIG